MSTKNFFPAPVIISARSPSTQSNEKGPIPFLRLSSAKAENLCVAGIELYGRGRTLMLVEKGLDVSKIVPRP